MPANAHFNPVHGNASRLSVVRAEVRGNRVSPIGFLLGLLSLVGIIALVYALYSYFRNRFIRSSGTEQLARELSRIATALESLALQKQEASKGEPHPLLGQPTPLKTPNLVPRPVEAEQEQPKGEPKQSGKMVLSMFGG
ncbi:MAG TPA: hypothetical protein VKB40_01445 [Candidatus Acidoferrales bacterium]|nr:hypothetical protein [Candidatus Acidoferrales bacterium]